MGLIAYMLTARQAIDWQIAPAMAVGALLSVPLAGITVKKLSDNGLRTAVGVGVTTLGGWTLINLVR